MRKMMSLGLAILLALPAAGLAATAEEAAIQQLQQQIQKLSAELEALAKKVEASKQAAPPLRQAPAAAAHHRPKSKNCPAASIPSKSTRPRPHRVLR